MFITIFIFSIVAAVVIIVDASKTVIEEET